MAGEYANPSEANALLINFNCSETDVSLATISWRLNKRRAFSTDDTNCEAMARRAVTSISFFSVRLKNRLSKMRNFKRSSPNQYLIMPYQHAPIFLISTVKFWICFYFFPSLSFQSYIHQHLACPSLFNHLPQTQKSISDIDIFQYRQLLCIYTR